MPAAAGAAKAELTPGTTSIVDAGPPEGLGFLAASPEDERVAALEPHHLVGPSRPCSTNSVVDPGLPGRLPGPFPTSMSSAASGASRSSSRAMSRS